MNRPPPIYHTTVVRPWLKLKAEAFRDGLRSSLLCQSESWKNYDVDSLACLYNMEIVAVLDRLIPQRTVTCRRRPSDPYGSTRNVVTPSAVSVGWNMRQVLPVKPPPMILLLLLPGMQSVEPTATFCVRSAKASGRPRSSLSGHRHVVCGSASTHSCDTCRRRQLLTTVDANDLHRCFDDKIAGVRASTANAPPPYFVPAPSNCDLSAFRVLKTDDIVVIIRKLPNKQCATVVGEIGLVRLQRMPPVTST